ncbi:MAG: hypothetical protein U5K31_10615 [Balneolaceae bacterium]|nr:hypothetical protein [Balneolaceae bacterium]
MNSDVDAFLRNAESWQDEFRKLLEKPGPNTQSGRVIRFQSVDEITEVEEILRTYIDEAIKLEKAGREVDFEKNRIPDYPHFNGAKQSKTRSRRINKHRDKIFEGKGMNEW